MLLLLGVGAYFQLGQDEDPPFTFRAMAMRVLARRHGAAGGRPVTDKLERTLQEVPYATRSAATPSPARR